MFPHRVKRTAFRGHDKQLEFLEFALAVSDIAVELYAPHVRAVLSRQRRGRSRLSVEVGVEGAEGRDHSSTAYTWFERRTRQG